jgi:Na+/melibiose symporter-like transporter
VLFGFWALITKLANALAVGIAFGALALVDFQSSAPTKEAVSMLGVLYGILPVVAKAVAIALLMRFSYKSLTKRQNSPTNAYVNALK